MAQSRESLGDEVEHGGHVFHRPVPVRLALRSREQAVESLHEGGRNFLGPVGQNSRQIPFDQSGDSDPRFEQLTGLIPDCPPPSAPVDKQLPGFLQIL